MSHIPRPPSPPAPAADPAAWTCWRDPAHPDAEPHPTFGWPRCVTCGASPAYYERVKYLPVGFTLTVYVPTGQPHWCAPGSAVVGCPTDEDRVTVFYEGWVHGGREHQGPRDRWEAGVVTAAGRMVTAYPTVASAWVATDGLHPVGSYDPRARTLRVTDEAALSDWLAVAPVVGQ